MVKTWLSALLALMLLLCARGGAAAERKEGSALVVYFSATGNTRAVAELITESLEADSFEIIPAEPYTEADLDYTGDCRANREQNDDNARPEMTGTVEDMGRYDTIFIGYPIWWGGLPKIVYTFLEQYDLSGKTVIPFCTSGGSGIGYSVEEIRKLQPDAEVNDGRRFAAGADVENIRAWIDGLSLR